MEYSQVHNSVILHGNSLERLAALKDESVDCVITDPPYFIDGMGDGWPNDKLRKSVSKAGVVGSMPVGMKFDLQQGKNLQRFIEDISNKIYRVLKPGGFYLSFSQGRLYHRMAVAIEDAGFEIRDMLVWLFAVVIFPYTFIYYDIKIKKKEKGFCFWSLFVVN